MDWVPIVFVTFKAAILFTGMFYAIKWHYDQDRKEKPDDNGAQSRAEIRLFGAMIIAFLLSLIGIVYAGCWGDVAEGGRGGAVACVFILLMFVMSRPDPRAVLSDSLGQQGATQDGAPAEAEPATLNESLAQLASLKLQSEHLRTALLVSLETARREKIYFGIASIASTLAWKFGDVAAGLLNSGH